MSLNKRLPLSLDGEDSAYYEPQLRFYVGWARMINLQNEVKLN